PTICPRCKRRQREYRLVNRAISGDHRCLRPEEMPGVWGLDGWRGCCGCRGAAVRGPPATGGVLIRVGCPGASGPLDCPRSRVPPSGRSSSASDSRSATRMRLLVTRSIALGFEAHPPPMAHAISSRPMVLVFITLTLPRGELGRDAGDVSALRPGDRQLVAAG